MLEVGTKRTKKTRDQSVQCERNRRESGGERVAAGLSRVDWRRIREEMALTFSLSGLRLSWVLAQVEGERGVKC